MDKLVSLIAGASGLPSVVTGTMDSDGIAEADLAWTAAVGREAEDLDLPTTGYQWTKSVSAVCPLSQSFSQTCIALSATCREQLLGCCMQCMLPFVCSVPSSPLDRLSGSADCRYHSRRSGRMGKNWNAHCATTQYWAVSRGKDDGSAV
ncbi:hypothetical protein B0T17DRAFT_603145 [Bombardia bombarda]|uniref:Uncharacterized protein n=1 Tax=Bombardia bombarda TaxID=252184 RepID=A0AA39TWQ4_9PEZI|nr:hypothetical protein B0T17DRAFT_603145 [Bombardia bombarda]